MTCFYCGNFVNTSGSVAGFVRFVGPNGGDVAHWACHNKAAKAAAKAGKGGS